MKKRTRWILIVVLALVLLAGGGALFYISPLLVMTPTPTGAVTDTGVVALNSGQGSLYFIPSDDGYILIDAGSGMAAVERALPEAGIDPLEVRHILLTHSDSDHVAALPLFPHAAIYMSAQELQMVDGTTPRFAVSHNALPVDLSGLSLVENGRLLELGGREILCIAAPGHTPGSMAFLVDGGWLFTGDAARVKDETLQVHPYTMNSGQAEATIEELYALIGDSRLVFTAHYGVHAFDRLQ